MTKEIKKLKAYQVLLLGCFLSFLITYNSNILVAKRAKNELNIEKKKLFDQIILNRRLEDADKTLSDSDKVCKKGSDELKDYYKTRELSKIELDDKPIKSQEKGKEYFEALLNIVKNYIGNDSSNAQGSQTSGGNTPDPGAEGGRRLNRKLEFNLEKVQDDIITYGKHIIPILAFLVIAILSIPGWLICCFCCCCNCCCCCCCKKPGCKIPCFIFTYIFYALSVVICVYVFSKTNKIFVGFANTECSVLKFFDEVLNGEPETKTPRWAGIDGINEILVDLQTQIDDMKENTRSDLQKEINNIDAGKTAFIGLMNSSADMFRDSTDKTKYDSQYLTREYDNDLAKGRYVLDLVNMFGRFDENKEKFIPGNSTLDAWEFEYKTVAGIADEYIGTAKDGFDEILDGNTEELVNSLNSGKDTLEQLRSSFDDIYSQVGKPIYEYSEKIDDYGKLGSKLVFGVLALMNIALAVFILLICFCSGKMCTNCCCCRCIFKFFTHLLWNILALLMIITFLVGFLFALVGTVGNDLMNVISFAVSEDNLGKNGEGILVDKLGKAKDYLHTCINGDGNIEKDLGISIEKLKSFDEINVAEERIRYAKEQFLEKQNTRITYNLFKSLYEERVALSTQDITLIPENKDFNNEDNSDFLAFSIVLTQMNYAISQLTNDHKNEQWDVDNPGYKTCSEGDTTLYPESVVFSSLKCKPTDREWIKTSDNENIKISAQIISDTVDKINQINNEYMEKLDDLNNEYTTYLSNYYDALSTFENTIKKITEKLRKYIGNGENLFGFINGKFIGTNIKIILKYLKSALGSDIKTIGICLLIVGCSLALSISSTILLIIVINVDIDNNKNNQVPEYKLNSGGRVIQYQ